MKTSQFALIAAVLFILFVAVCLVCVNYLFPGWHTKSETVEIPDSVGLDESEIKDTEYFKFNITYRESDDNIGKVLTQTPAAGSIRKLSDGNSRIEIKLTVAKAYDKIKLENYEGIDYRQAELELRKKGLKTQAVKAKGVQDVTVRISPMPDSWLSRGDTVTLYVGNGQRLETVTVPDFENLGVLQAVTGIIASGLYLGEIEYKYSDTTPSGCVIEQSRAYGTVMPEHTKISLTVSLGSEFEDNNENYIDNNENYIDNDEVINEIY